MAKELEHVALRWIAMGVGILVLATFAPRAHAGNGPPSFVAFESGQVRPLATSPDGQFLYAVNTPAGRLEIFRVASGRLLPWGSAPVGLEPVAVASRRNRKRGTREVWVVNHLSDSISIVDASRWPARVVRTLHVGDEPQDVVFAGPDRSLAFVTTAHRGQNSPSPRSDFDAPGVGRADVWVFDTRSLGESAGGDPLTVLTLFGDKPRALAASPDGSRVYAAVFRSGNRTATINGLLLCPGGADAEPCEVLDTPAPGGLPAPSGNVEGEPPPVTAGMIVQQDPTTGEWLDELGRDWSSFIRFELPDLDVFEIDALSNPPRELRSIPDVGTVLFNMAVNPVSGNLYVSNTEARNEVRFEGPGELASQHKPPGEPATVRGHLHEARITVIDSTGASPRHLNKHIPYEISPVPPGVKEHSLATPVGMALSRDGSTLYLAAFGSSKIGIFDIEALESDTFVPNAADHIRLTGAGPSGLVLDERHNRIYTLTRFDNTVSVVDLDCRCEVQRWPLHNPEPESIVAGRPFLYDAQKTSSNGEASCASCHVFGDVDDLAWDLGNPDGLVVANANTGVPGSAPPAPFHPMKGSMTTQSLRGLANHGPMHWRGDRTGGTLPSPESEQAAFRAFDVAFDGLLGRDAGPLTEDEMQSFTDFALQLERPPNAIRRLDDSLRDDEARGLDLFLTKRSVFPRRTCISCHSIDPAKGLFGTPGPGTPDLAGPSAGTPAEPMKVPHLRNLYQKIGMFGSSVADGAIAESAGPQVRGFGFGHSGDQATLFHFLSFPLFLLTDDQQADIEAFLLAFPGRFAPIVGQQVTLTASNSAEVAPWIDLLAARADAPQPTIDDPLGTECDLVVKGVVDRRERGWLRTADGHFRPDRAEEPELSDTDLRSLATSAGAALTYTCVPPGSGVRLALDRDEDGALDGDELAARSDPGDPASTPPNHGMACGRGFQLAWLTPLLISTRRRGRRRR